MADDPTSPPAGRTRVPRFLDEAEQAAGSGGAPSPAPAPQAPTPVQFFNGHVSTPEIKAKQGKALQQLLQNRDRADADPDDSDTSNA